MLMTPSRNLRANFANRPRVGVIVGLGFAGVASLAVGYSLQAPPPARPSASARSPLIVGPDPIQLGMLAPGRSARLAVSVRNPSVDPVVISRVETSCPCVRATPDRLSLAPGESSKLTLTFDPSGEPGFRGKLAVEYVGRSPDGSAVARGTVHLEVKDSTKSSALASAALREVPR